MKPRNILDVPMLQLSDSDSLTGRDLCEGLICFGATGSGKSSTILPTLVLSLMMAGAGFLFLCPKAEDRATYTALARRAGREQDVVVLSADGDESFDPIQYVWSTSGDIEAVIDCYDILLTIGKGPTSSGGGDRFFEQATHEWTRAAITVLDLAGEPVSISGISDVLDSLPANAGDYLSHEWQHNSRCAALIAKVKECSGQLSPTQWADLDVASRLLLERIPQMDPRTRSNVGATASALADRFRYSRLKRAFANGRTTFTPEQVGEGRIVIIDFPYTVHGIETSRLVGAGVKAAFQRGFLRRRIDDTSRLVCIVADECHLSALPGGRDQQFASICRSQRVVQLSFSQSANAIADAFHEATPSARTRSWIANHNTKVALANSCPTTNELMAALIGKSWSSVRNVGFNAENPNISESEHLRHLVEPITFAGLARPDGVSPVAEGVVFAGGKRFNATKTPSNPQGLPFLHVGFTRP